MELSQEMRDRIPNAIWEFMEKVEIDLSVDTAVLLHDKLFDAVIDVLGNDHEPDVDPNDLGFTTPRVLGTLLVAIAVAVGAFVLGGLLSEWLVTR